METTSRVWHAADFADGDLKEEAFCIRFASVENCKSFKDKIEKITELLAKDNGESKEVEAAASLIEKLSVEGKDKEVKTEAKEAAAPTSSEEKKDDIEKQENLATRSRVFGLVWIFMLTRVESWVI